MCHIPKFHPTKTSARVHTEGTAKPLNPPPRKLINQTVGFKLSYLLIFPRYHLDNGDIEEKAKDIIRNALKVVRFQSPKVCKFCKQFHEYSLPISFDDPDKNEPKYTHWMVEIDHNAHLEDHEYDQLTERYFVVGIQVISRCFWFLSETFCPGDWSPNPSTNMLAYHNHHGERAAHCWSIELKAVNDALLTLSKQPNYRVITNEFTDLKVYTGNGSLGVHLDVAKSLTSIFTAFERQFDAINTTKRIGGGVRGRKASVTGRPKLYRYISDDKTTVQEEAGECCKPMSSVNQSYMELQGWETGYQIPKFLRMFLKTNCDRVRLQGFLENDLISHLNTVLDISRVWDEKLIKYNPEYVKYCMKKPTITFRSQANTLDYARQFAWIDLCGVLTDSCYREDTRKVTNWLHKRWKESHTDYTIMNIIDHADGMIEENIEYWRRASSKVADPESTIRQPYLAQIIREYEAEVAHSDPLKETRVPMQIIVKSREQHNAENVRDKIKHKFDLGLYGKFPEETVIDFALAHDEKWSLAKGNYNHLILRRKTSKGGIRSKLRLNK